MIAHFCVDNGIGAAATQEILRTVLPECRQDADGGGVVANLEEITQPFSLRSAVGRELGIVDVDLQLGRKEIREANVGKIEDEPWAPDEVNKVIYNAQINRSYRANKFSFREGLDCSTCSRLLEVSLLQVCLRRRKVVRQT